MGYTIEPVAGPSGRRRDWRIVGIPHRACLQFSKRSHQIATHVADAGHHSYRARQVAARATRGEHCRHGTAEMRPRWHAELDAIGLPVGTIQSELDLARRRSTGSPRDLTDDQIDWIVADLLGSGGELAQRNVFTRSRLIAELAPRLYGYTAAALDYAVDRILDSEQVVLLDPLPHTAAHEPAYGLAAQRRRAS